MKNIEIDDDLYHYIASQTRRIGESASEILRRLLLNPQTTEVEIEHVADEVSIAPIVIESSSTGQKVFDMLSKQDLQADLNIVGRFLVILSALARTHKTTFASVLEIKGRNRVYFARNEADLLEAGSSTNPKQIPNSEFWVITNSNTTRKKMMLTEAALKLGYSDEEAERIRDFL